MQLIQQPFPHIELNNFLPKEQAIQILQAVTKLKFKHIESDLFSFLQTADLSNNKTIQNFITQITSKEFINKLQHATKLKLSGKIDLFASNYNSTHYLLPHDDQLDTRKIAFFYYLSKPTEGGDLALYNSEKNQPTTISKKIKPQFNKFAFFTVSKKSFHEVEEVITGQRIALSGWFH